MLASRRLDPKCGFFSLISAQKKIYHPIAIQISKYLLVMPKCQDFLVLGYFYGSLDNIPRHLRKINWLFRMSRDFSSKNVLQFVILDIQVFFVIPGPGMGIYMHLVVYAIKSK
jgi:hypothetical protein